MNNKLIYLVFLYCILFITQLYAQGVRREIVWSEYPYPLSEEFKERIKFGHIIVPETRNSDNPRTLKIAFTILKGSSNTGMQHPIIQLPGGPGGQMTGGANAFLMSSKYKERFKYSDVILFDPRGCGKSEPDLCPGMDLPDHNYQGFLGRSQKEMEKETLKVLKNCLDSLALKKVDLNAYGSDEIAEDIEDLRISLSVKKWNIMGISYGSRFAQGLIRKFPETVRSAVLGGLVPTVRKYDDNTLKSFSRSLQIILNKCANDKDCSIEYPGLEKKLFDALQYYNDNPLVVPAKDHKIFKDKDVLVTGNLILSGILILTYGGQGPEIIPRVIQAIYLKKEWVLVNFMNSMGDTFGALENDMNLFISLNDNPSYKPDLNSDEYDDFTKKLIPFYYDSNLMSQHEMAQYCGIELDSTQEIPIPSEVPVLLATGEFDPVTPPENTYKTAEYLTNSLAITFPDNGHWVNGPKCYSELITSFYKNPVVPKDIDDCISQTEPLKFVTGVSNNEGIVQIGSKILMGKQNQIYIPLGISVLFIFFGFLGFPIKAVIRFIKERKNQEFEKSKTNWIPWILTLLLTVFIALFYVGIMESMNRNAYILGFGILSSWNWIFWIVLLVLILLIYSLLIRNRILSANLSKFSRMLTLISWMGSTLFIGLLFYWEVL